MRLNLYCVYDRAAHVFSNVHTEVNDAVAARSFRVAYASVFGKLPSYDFDLQLYRIGCFDTESGKLEIVNLEKVVDRISDVGAVPSFGDPALPDEFGGIYL